MFNAKKASYLSYEQMINQYLEESSLSIKIKIIPSSYRIIFFPVYNIEYEFDLKINGIWVVSLIKYAIWGQPQANDEERKNINKPKNNGQIGLPS